MVNNICTININTADKSALPDITSQVYIDGLTQPGNSSLCNLGYSLNSFSNYHVVIQGDGVDIASLRFETGNWF
ncbi:MAG: hypothetical protein R3F25_10015 [Gammaproteobacteria bacterium]